MRNFVGGVIVGIILSGTIALAGNLYNSKGEPAEPRGSVQQFDRFRERGLQLDVQALRRQADQDRAAGRVPCAK